MNRLKKYIRTFSRQNKGFWFDQLIYGGSLVQITVLLIVTLLVFTFFGLAFWLIWGNNIGFYNEMDESEHLWQLYYFFSDPGNQMSMSGPLPKGARVIGLIMSTLGSIFLGGLLISTITNTIERRVEQYRKGENYYNLSDHVVIIGSDQMLHGIINHVCSTDVRHIVVLTSEDVERTRASIFANLRNKDDYERIVVNFGMRDCEEYLTKIHINQAREVYIIGDDSEFDEIENFHDSLNIQCLTLIARICDGTRQSLLPCYVSFDYKTTYHVFEFADLAPEITAQVDFEPFNFYDFWAHKVLVSNCSPAEDLHYKPLDYRPITSVDSDEYVHFIVIGLSNMGQAMALQAAHIAHYPNYRRRKTRITIIDRNMLQEMDEFKQKCGELFEVSRSTYIDADRWVQEGKKYEENFSINLNDYGHLVDKDADDPAFMDIEWTFIKGDDGNPKVRELLDEYVRDTDAIITVAVCLNFTHRSLRSAMYLPKRYYEKVKGQYIPILVQQRKTSTIAETLAGYGFDDDRRLSMRYANIVPFGMVYDGYDIHIMLQNKEGKRINAVYNYYFNHDALPTEIDDHDAELQWAKLSIPLKWSNKYAADSFRTKLRSIGLDFERIKTEGLYQDLTDEQIEILARMEHNRWNTEKLLLGYRPVLKDEDEAIDADRSLKKSYSQRHIHYDIRPYDGLKEDKSGRKAWVYDQVIIRSLKIITGQ